MSLNCKVQITINNIPQEKADTVKKALEPDNIDFPKGLSMNIQNIDNKLIFNFESKENMKHIIGTIDEVLEHTKIALEVIK